MSYCTYADIVAHTGTELAQSIVEALIADADRRINARLRAGGITPIGTDERLVSASISFTSAAIVTRGRLDGTAPSSQSVGGASVSDNKDSLAAQLKAEGEQAVSDYIAAVRGDGSELDHTRVDAVPYRSQRWA